ncbi:Cdc6/Cdc18 family protein [Natronobacterium gregoryi]|uniref:AAA ATPase n=2 Tax=Natronobacterium gregoryi TaxID=44930 RepID=L0AGS6_NATGS|nr:AAA family ATPase [Natronobacterium gregoryi]AFZ73021.1 Cdc6-related protein, AAA superfamily ATPase [Natronobacterium gregoryi SP2]ELY64876.1 AAA ATPase [Natronobacterium gregoryi SP2]PLK18381.1 AAA family ATPase [Natronobacterium gregoryi SP2]SFJ71696.1 Cdc6-related protein, AAA superfamily ATPase [Natronobacterium gregoryi]
MIADPRAFDDSYDGVELLHREGEMRDLFERLTGSPENGDVLVSGPSGVGKTLFAHKALDRLEQRRPIYRVHVNCLGKTTAGIHRAVLEAHPNGPDAVPRTTGTDSVRRTLRESIDRETVVVLDEGDDLPETDAVGGLLRFRDVTLIVITHDKKRWLSRLDVDDGHSFDRGHVNLERYGIPELTKILRRRARQGFHQPDVVSRQHLQYIADGVAGVARNAIQWLWGAATVAHERDHVTIQDEDVKDGKERAWRRVRELNLESLPTHHRVLYAIVHDAGEISGEELHNQYNAVKDDLYRDIPACPIGKRARREKFSKLREYDLVDYDGSTRARTYWVIDESVTPQLELPTSVGTSPTDHRPH